MQATVTRPVACPARQAWAALAQLARLHEWAPDVVESPSDPLAVGAVRRARLRRPAQGKDVLVERMTAVRPGESLTYVIEGGIGPLRTIVTTWRVTPDPADPARSLVTVASDIAVNPLLALLVGPAWRRTLGRLADGFAAWAPTA